MPLKGKGLLLSLSWTALAKATLRPTIAGGSVLKLRE